MANLFDMKGGKMLAILHKFAEQTTPEIGEEIVRDPRLINIMLGAAREHLDKNHYKMSSELQLAVLRRTNDEEKWGITEEDFVRLAATAPTWPKGKHAYRSFRIRFGEGSEGIRQTFEKHLIRIKSVFGKNGFQHGEDFQVGRTWRDVQPVGRLRLLNGDQTHNACIEWVVADLGTNRKRSAEAVQGVKSLADELLVIAWLFPEMIRAIDHIKLPGFIAAGYEVKFDERDGETWPHVVVVGFISGDIHRVEADYAGRNYASSGCSVPELLDLPALAT